MTTAAATAQGRSPYVQPAFIAAALTLLVAAVGLNFTVAALKLHFKKLAVPLREQLGSIPERMGDWVQVSRDEPLDHDLQEVLATDQYIFRDYLNYRLRGGQCAADFIAALHDGDDPAKVEALRTAFLAKDEAGRLGMLEEEMKNKSADQRRAAVMQVQQSDPDAAINMAVTYYTGSADTVAHIPDRCYIADGFEPTDYNFPDWELSGGRKLSVRFINFQDTTGASRVDRSVAYFFNVNGGYESNPEGVRLRLQNLFMRYGYYAKVELMTLDPDHGRSAKTMTNFLSSALGQVEKCFPDWSKYANSGS